VKENRQKTDRRKACRRTENRILEEAHKERVRKLHSLLEIGQLIGLELKINEILLRIAEKACEVMEADRCSLFLHDPATDELWSTVAIGMGEQVIRIPSNVGIVGHCFQTGETVNLEDAYQNPTFDRRVDEHTGYRTRNLLSMPLFNRAAQRLGCVQLLNKKNGIFTEDDETFLKTFGNHASVFIEMAQLQKAKIDALEQSRKELEQVSKVKSKALDHLSHELRTPLAVIKGNIGILRHKLQASFPELIKSFDTLEKHLNRLFEIQQETDKIIQSNQELERCSLSEEFERIWERLERISKIPPEMKARWGVLRELLLKELQKGVDPIKPIFLFPVVEQTLKTIRQLACHREIQFHVAGEKELTAHIDPYILGELLKGLLKNAIENTPEEGIIWILLEKTDQKVFLRIQDFGIGITEENQKYIFDGLFHPQESDLYTTKKPYDFGAGGKGLELLRMKILVQRAGFNLSLDSRRCTYLPTDQDICPGRISQCPHCQDIEGCQASGGSIFSLSFPMTV
jgi:signal transduction histidine kinase